MRRPDACIGGVWTAVGVVSQSESGHRLLARSEADVQRGRAAAGGSNGTVRAKGVQDDMTWNHAPIYLPITGAVLTMLPQAPATLWEAWLLIR
jgi:hypothetical protein